MLKLRISLGTVAIALIILPSTPNHQTFYLIYAGALVFFMQVGFAMLLAGSIRSKNVKNVLLWNLLDSAGGALGFWSLGYAFAYGGDDPGKGWTFIGNRGFFLSDDIDMEFCESLRIFVSSLLIALNNWIACKLQGFFQFAFACALSSIGKTFLKTRMKR